MVDVPGLRRTKNYIPLKGINTVAPDAKHSINIHLCSRYSKFQAEVMCFILPKITGNVPGRYIEHDSWKLATRLLYADPGFAHLKDVRMLIGVELFFDLLRPGKYIGNGRDTTLQKTQLGWILMGRMQHPGQPFGEPSTSCLTVEENCLYSQLQRFWAVEEFYTLPKTT
jgi:hypothetical protein